MAHLPKMLSFSNALNGMKRRQAGYNLMTGMLPNFGKAAAPAAAPMTSDSPVSTVLDSVFGALKKVGAFAKRVLLKPEEPFVAPVEKKSYQVFRRSSAYDAEVRHVAVALPQGQPTAEVLTDSQELGEQMKPTLWEKLTPWKRGSSKGETVFAAPAAVLHPVAPETVADAPRCSEFAATCPGKPEKNLIADGFEKRMAEKKAAAPVAPVAPKVAPVAKVNSAAKPEVKQSIPSKLRESIFGRSKKNAAQPAVQGELALENVRPIRNDLSDADLEVVSSASKVGTGHLQTLAGEKAQSTAISRRAPKKTDSAINSVAETPQAEPTPELVARV